MNMDIPVTGMEMTDSVPAPVVDTPSEIVLTETAPAPETTTVTETNPAPEPEKPAADAPATEQLFELPDGRKVDAATLQKEWKENFLPDYTRKSQDLAKLTKGDPQIINKDEPEWMKPGYEPKSYAEVIQIAKGEALKEITGKAQEAQQREAAIAAEVDGQLTAIKAIDPTLDENALFQHANKWGFTDLKAAHTNMKEFKRVEVDTEQRVLKNIKARGADPVATVPSSTPVTDDSYDPSAVSSFSSAVEFFQARKK